MAVTDDRDTPEERMLRTGLEMIAEQGLTLSLEHLRMEEIIKRAGVARATVYRRWRTRQDYFDALLLEVARGSHIDRIANAEVGLLGDQVGHLIESHRRGCVEPAGRHNLMVELLRVSLELDMGFVAGSPSWRNYLALTAAYQGLAEGDLRTAIGQELTRTEAAFRDSRAVIHHRFASLLGYRLTPSAHGAGGWPALSAAAGALMTGLVVKALTDPALLISSIRARAFGSSIEATWSPGAYAIGELVLGRLEPDPDLAWDTGRLDELVPQISRLAGL